MASFVKEQQSRAALLLVVRSGRPRPMTCSFPGESSSASLQAPTDFAVPSRMGGGGNGRAAALPQMQEREGSRRSVAACGCVARAQPG
jgi:hypothetical protein